MKTGWREVQVTHKGTDTSNGGKRKKKLIAVSSPLMCREEFQLWRFNNSLDYTSTEALCQITHKTLKTWNLTPQ